MALSVVATSSRSYRTGTFLRFSNSNVESCSVSTALQKYKTLTMTISLPFACLNALVHLTFRGLRFILKFLWHLDEQKRKHLASFRTNMVPWPG